MTYQGNPTTGPRASTARRGGRSCTTASSSPRSRTAPRRGSPATTGRRTRRATGSRWRQPRHTTSSPTAGWSTSAAAPAGPRGSTTSPSRWPRTSRRCRSAGTAAALLDDRAGAHPRACGPAALASRADAALARQADMMAVFTRRFGPYPFAAVHRRGHRRRARDPSGGAGARDLRRQLRHDRLGVGAPGRARAGAPVVRQQPDRPVLARHLAARGVRLLRRVALVRGVRRAPRRRARAAALATAGTAAAGAHPRRPGPGADVRRPGLQAGRAACSMPCGSPWGTRPSSRCCAPGWTPTPTGR